MIKRLVEILKVARSEGAFDTERKMIRFIADVYVQKLKEQAMEYYLGFPLDCINHPEYVVVEIVKYGHRLVSRANYRDIVYRKVFRIHKGSLLY